MPSRNIIAVETEMMAEFDIEAETQSPCFCPYRVFLRVKLGHFISKYVIKFSSLSLPHFM